MESGNDIKYLWQALRTAQEESEKYKNNFMSTLVKSDKLYKKLKYFEKSLQESLITREDLEKKLENVSQEFKRQKHLVDHANALLDRIKKLTTKNLKDRKKLEEAGKKENLLSLRVTELEAEVKAESELSAQKDEMIAELSARVKALLDSENIKALFSGEGDPRLNLLSRLKKSEDLSADLAEKIKGLEAEKDSLKARAEALASEKSALEAELSEAAGRAKELFKKIEEEKNRTLALEAEKRELHNIRTSMTAELSRLSAALKESDTAREELSRSLMAREVDIAGYKDALKSALLKADMEKNNFADAVKKVFSLQSSLQELRDKIKGLSNENSDLRSQLEDRRLSMEKINALLVNSGMELRQEKEITKKLSLRAEQLNGELASLTTQSRNRHAQMLDLINTLKEKDETISALKKQLARIDELEVEVEELKRKNQKLTGMIRKDQFDFNDRIISHLNKISRDIKLGQLKNPGLGRTLIPIEKNFLNVINLMKSWQDYIDDSPLQKETVAAREFFENFFNPWEKVFIRKKIVFIKNNILPDTIKTRLNQEKIKITLYQIIKNEYEYLPVGATLRILIKKDEQEKNIIIAFEDTSEGLPPEVADRLFLPFNTTKKDHAGIGFAIAHRIVALHDGTLKISSGGKKGLNIEIALPIYTE